LTELVDRPISLGSTLYRPSKPSPGTQAARDFYELGLPVAHERRLEILATDETMSWLAEWMEKRINALLRLPEAWNGRQSRQITFEAAQAAVFAAFAITKDTKLGPQIFPLADGGLQLEWHAAGLDLELEIDAVGEAHVLAVDPNGTELINDELSTDPPLNVDVAHGVLLRIAARVAGIR
jgi:hypothetical protein